MMARDRVMDDWLHQQVGPAYDALNANPSLAASADQVRSHLAADHAKFIGAGPADLRFTTPPQPAHQTPRPSAPDRAG